ncbi:hypothetical protein SteCoe_37633 [Stentor coeruleus]|uniref:Centrosomal protein of 19 kDa n=1 Tax=Stentor coeruleus TaxID=5963 RepID=A0A1R2AMP7_9CILI|nr:hypothetical protein SteCoe_37633 [Stentor coeruleus]
MDRIEPIKIAGKYNPPKLGIVYKLGQDSFIHEFHLAPESLNETSEALIEALFSNFPVYFRNINPYQVKGILDKMKAKQKPGLNRFSKPQMLNQAKKQDDLKKYNQYIDDQDLHSPDEEGSDDFNYGDVDKHMDQDESFSDEYF